MCAGGNTRSVTLATLLKYHYGKHDALACSWESNDEETLNMLFQWANLILPVDKTIYAEMKEQLESHCMDKVQLADIGQDKWGMSMHPELIPVACTVLEGLGFKSAKQWEEIVARGSKYDLRRKESAADPL